MKDRKFHNKKPQDNYPTPGVPADDAWAAMNKLLDADSKEPSIPGHRKIPGHNRIYELVVLLISVVTLFFLVNIMKYQEKIPSKNARTNKAVNYASNGNADTARILNNQINKFDVGKKASNEMINVKAEDNREENEPMLHADTGSASAGNKIRGAVSGSHITEEDTRKNNFVKDNKTNAANVEAVIKPTSGVYNSNSEKVKKNNDAKNFAGATGRQPNSGIPRGQAFWTEHEVSKIDNIGTVELNGISSFLATFITSRPRANVDSFFLQNLRNAVSSVGSSRNKKVKASNKITVTRKAGFEYGFQWDVPIPLQGTAGYFRGTNGKSKPYNLLLPQVWLSKGFKRKSRIFVSLDFSRQYFINNKEHLERAFFMPPRDTGISETFLYKTAGIGAGLAYSYEINENLAAALGIDYTINRTALLNKQTRNAITGHIISDSLYGINRQSSDWRYINNNMLAAKFELNYTFKKVALGAAVYFPLKTIPVYSNSGDSGESEPPFRSK